MLRNLSHRLLLVSHLYPKKTGQKNERFLRPLVLSLLSAARRRCAKDLACPWFCL
ncbi:hypothetical protein SynROS8604_02177 [Synechococcus sp. ROS8604]|nr:hypothetical protein SynROS8604_02177 [Synechococcus sp. ROS8604]